MKAVLASIVMVVACGRSSDSNRGGSAEPVARSVPAPTPVPPPAPPAPPPTAVAADAAPAPNVNCAALVTTEDLTQVCGAGFQVKPETNAIAVQYSLCALKVTAAGTDDRLASIGLLAKHDAVEADNFTKLTYQAATPVAGLGDRAWSKVTDHPDRHSTDYDVGVVKGRMVLTIASTKNELIPHPPCTIDKFVELLRRATPRLP